MTTAERRRIQERKIKRSDAQRVPLKRRMRMEYFVEGQMYSAPCLGGDTGFVYCCVHVSKELVIFTFQYQGRERSYTAYANDIWEGDFNRRGSKEQYVEKASEI